MHERTTARRLGVIVSAGLVAVGLAALPASSFADNGGDLSPPHRQVDVLQDRDLAIGTAILDVEARDLK